MKRFTDAGRAAIDAGNFYAGLSLALMMPDICGSLEDPGRGKSEARYVRWCKVWVEPKFTSETAPDGKPVVFISAEDCYQLRCSLIHSGQSYIDPSKIRDFNRFEFFDETVGAHLNRFQRVRVGGQDFGGFLQLKADRFSLTMFEAADEWDAAKANDADVQKEKAKLLVIRSKGFTVGRGGVTFA
jgi:hypothetical protein